MEIIPISEIQPNYTAFGSLAYGAILGEEEIDAPPEIEFDNTRFRTKDLIELTWPSRVVRVAEMDDPLLENDLEEYLYN